MEGQQFAAPAAAQFAQETVRRTRSWDGVEIAFAVSGAQDPTILFIHGGLANRHFWTSQLTQLSSRYRVAALDLGGHGDSGTNRLRWTIEAFADDVRVVAEALESQQLVLVGNSLGGAVALEAATMLRGRVLAIIGVDTLHDLNQRIPLAVAQARADAFRANFEGTCRAMVAELFHPGAQADLRAWVERQTCATPVAVAAGMMEGLADYDLAGAARRAGVPIRAINGDLWSVDAARNRAIVPDFDAVVIPNAGHYLMLERPAEFNRELVALVDRLRSRYSLGSQE